MKYLTIILLFTLTGCLSPTTRELAEKSYELGCLTSAIKAQQLDPESLNLKKPIIYWANFCHEQSKQFLDK